MKKSTKTIMKAGAAIIGGTIIYGATSKYMPAGVSKNVGTALEIGSIAMPIAAAGMVMGSTEMLTGKKRKKNSIL